VTGQVNATEWASRLQLAGQIDAIPHLSNLNQTSHGIRCQCGSLLGEVSNTHHGIHAVCYCIDCRTYAFCLSKSAAILDKMGGTEVVATQARHVSFTNGLENLACLSLSPNGTLRWFAKCCNTPIANTPRNWHVPYVSLIHTCLVKPLEDAFPPVQMHVKAKSAKGKPPRLLRSKIAASISFSAKLIFARLRGSYKQTPFFLSTGFPRVEVQVLSSQERENLRNEALA